MSLQKTFLPAFGLLSLCTQLLVLQETAYAVRGLMICNVEGTAQLLPGGDPTAAVSAEKNVFLANTADTLITSSNGSVRVGIDEFLGRIDVLEATRIGIADMVREASSNSTRLSLTEGSIHVSFYRSHVDPESVFILQTPTAVLTVVGDFLPPDMPLVTQERLPQFLSYAKGDNREAFCSDPVDFFETENFDAWEPAVTVSFDTGATNAVQVLDGLGDNKNVPNFLVAVAPDGTTNIQVDSGMVFVEKRAQSGELASGESYSGESIYNRIQTALSYESFDDSVGMVAGPGMQVIVPPY
ncbi:MAG: hypothetical protein AAGE59_06110 [Cyanobacteria bacterium P01_F01_bin.86]